MKLLGAKATRDEDEVFSSEKTRSSGRMISGMIKQFVLMNWMRKPTSQDRHDVVEYVLPTVSVTFPEVNFGMCFEHKDDADSLRRKRKRKIRKGNDPVFFQWATTGRKATVEIKTSGPSFVGKIN
jgi:hypothetical protein